MIDGGTFGQKKLSFERWTISTPGESPQLKKGTYMSFCGLSKTSYNAIL
jgi:hypothetical protein